jgi:NAD(P)H dehydrogenase (quinone)
VIRHLLARADPPAVVALTRRPEAIRSTPGLTARHADYEDPASLRAAYAGLETLVFISSDGVAEPMRRHHGNVVAAAVDAGVEHVVYTSIVDVAPDSRFYYSPIHQETEALLAASNMRVCLARTSIFADFFLSTWIAPALEHGTLALSAGAGRMSLVTRDDVACGLAAAATAGREGVVDLTGPAALTAGEIAAITQDATGRPLRYDALEDDEYRRRLAAEEAPGWLIEAFTSMFGSVREGRFAVVSEDIPRLTGEPQRTWAEFLRAAVELRTARVDA